MGPSFLLPNGKAIFFGAIGAALLTLVLTRRWLKPARDTRALEVTGTGRREFRTHLGIRL